MLNIKSTSRTIISLHYISPSDEGTLLMVSVSDGEKMLRTQARCWPVLGLRPTTDPSSYHPHVLRIESPYKEV